MTRKEVRLLDAVRTGTDEELMKALDDMDVSDIRALLIELVDGDWNG